MIFNKDSRTRQSQKNRSLKTKGITNMREMSELKMEIIHHRPILSKSQEFDLVEEEEELSYDAGEVRKRKTKIIR